MSYYRLYFFGPSARILRASEFDCSTDAEAIGLAAGQQGGDAMELWNRARLVRRFPVGQPESSARA